MPASEKEIPKCHQVHFILQGKGGVGKSLVAAVLGQYFQARKVALHCFDTGPVNATFAQYQALSAAHLNVLRRGAIYDKRFDELVEKICNQDGICIVDTGATPSSPCGTTSWKTKFCVSSLPARGACLSIRLSREDRR
jgi:hypothetical protein